MPASTAKRVTKLTKVVPADTIQAARELLRDGFSVAQVTERTGVRKWLAEQLKSEIVNRLPPPEAKIIPENYDATTRAMLETALAELEPHGLSLRAINTLERAGLLFVSDLLAYRPAELLTVTSFSRGQLNEVFRALENIGLYRVGRQPAACQAVA
ncbi:MAG: DNA-directed RNA polymerase subunit alpha C-terminal domain-containing protein [Pirellulales bacterium]